MQQQQQQQQQVIIQQPMAQGMGSERAPQNIRDWSTGICGCFSDCGTCLMGYFCFTCMLCRIASKMDESCCVPLCLPSGLIAMRTKLRTEYGIKGSICQDWACMTCCTLLAACQMDRELTHFGR